MTQEEKNEEESGGKYIKQDEIKINQLRKKCKDIKMQFKNLNNHLDAVNKSNVIQKY